MSDAAQILSQNLFQLRKQRGLSQKALSERSGIPRSTLTHFESGQGNPTLGHLFRLAEALQVRLEELVARPQKAHAELFPADQIRRINRSSGRAAVFKLLPDRLPGMEIDRMEIQAGGRIGGVPHIKGTREFFTVVQGQASVVVSGEHFEVNEGDVLAFEGDQRHSYENKRKGTAVCISVVVLTER